MTAFFGIKHSMHTCTVVGSTSFGPQKFQPLQSGVNSVPAPPRRARAVRTPSASVTKESTMGKRGKHQAIAQAGGKAAL